MNTPMKTITMKELSRRIHKGFRPVIRFTKTVENYDGYFEENMMARIVSSPNNNNNDTVHFVFRVEEFDKYNGDFESSNYYDNVGQPNLTAREANMHPERNDWCEDLWFDSIEETSELFEIVEDSTTELFAEYSKTNQYDSYVKWLEDQLKKVLDEKNDLAKALVGIRED